MDEGLTDPRAVSALRSVAHPVRLRILSLVTAEAMSAADVARALDLTHANALYHLRVLHDAGELVVESEEKIRGGLRLTNRPALLRGGDLGPGAKPGDPAGSAIIGAVEYRDLEMPPSGKIPAAEIGRAHV